MNIEMTPIEKMYWDAAKEKIPSLRPQEWIGKFRVDFLILDKACIIELDGHEYHKTREQRKHDASRERFLEKNGYQVIRFTGNEIYNDVEMCVKETIQIINVKPRSACEIKSSKKICYHMQRVIELLLYKHCAIDYRDGLYLKLEIDYFDPLSIELVEENIISIAHSYTEFGELIYDLRIEFLISNVDGNDGWIPYSYSSPGVFHPLIRLIGSEIVVLNELMLKDVASFSESWAKNLLSNGWLENAKVARKNQP
ncbi:MAG: DUF559 domain-containing protein [Cellvibrio sp.]|uniref:endonuclease domain-containing protein n=1 Tax=Cellvibrio sp. TaxID=1965322 RepID=UPI0031B0EA30